LTAIGKCGIWLGLGVFGLIVVMKTVILGEVLV